MVSDVASTLETMSAPIERRLELLQRIASVFDQIDATGRGREKDPTASTAQLMAEARTELTIARALNQMGDVKGAIERVDKAESRATRLSQQSSLDTGGQLIVVEVQLEKSLGLSKLGETEAATRVLDEAIENLRELQRVPDPKSESRRKLEILLCKALVRRVQLVGEFTNPCETSKLLIEAVAYGERTYKADPSDKESFKSYVSGLNSMGYFLYGSGRFDTFQEPARKALTLCRQALAKGPTDVAFQQFLARTITNWTNRLNSVESSDGKAEDSAGSVEIMRRLCVADPNNVELQEQFIEVLGNYGIFLSYQNDFDGPKAPFNEALRIAKGLLDRNKADYDTKDFMQVCAATLCECYVKTADLDNAKRTLQELVIPLTQELRGVDKDQARNRYREAYCRISQAEIATAEQKWSEAEQLLSRCVWCLERNCETRNYPYEIEGYGDSLAKLGAVLCHTGRPQEGYQYIERGLRILYSLPLRFGIRAVASDISDAEQALKECKRCIENGSRSVAATSN